MDSQIFKIDSKTIQMIGDMLVLIRFLEKWSIYFDSSKIERVMRSFIWEKISKLYSNKDQKFP